MSANRAYIVGHHDWNPPGPTSDNCDSRASGRPGIPAPHLPPAQKMKLSYSRPARRSPARENHRWSTSSAHGVGDFGLRASARDRPTGRDHQGGRDPECPLGAARPRRAEHLAGVLRGRPEPGRRDGGPASATTDRSRGSAPISQASATASITRRRRTPVPGHPRRHKETTPLPGLPPPARRGRTGAAAQRGFCSPLTCHPDAFRVISAFAVVPAAATGRWGV